MITQNAYYRKYTNHTLQRSSQMSVSVEVITTLLNEYNISLFSNFFTTLIIIMCIEVIENIQFIYIFQKHVICIILDIYACISGSMPLQVEYLSLSVSAAQQSVILFDIFQSYHYFSSLRHRQPQSILAIVFRLVCFPP